MQALPVDYGALSALGGGARPEGRLKACCFGHSTVVPEH
jgi:hypothetical protein